MTRADPPLAHTLAQIDAAVVPALAWLAQHQLTGRRLRADSRQVERGDVFMAMPGVVPGRSQDGRTHIDQALGRGAQAALVEAEGWSADQFNVNLGVYLNVPILPVKGLRALSGYLAARYYDEPSRKLLTVGVTGTNGKTSCTHWIAQGMTQSGRRGGVLGTVGSGFPGTDAFTRSGLTTPEAVALHTAVHQLRADGAQMVALEASSIGLAQGRLDGMHFDIAVFTNLTRDHLDYHGDMATYEAAKTALFDWPGLGHAVINLDDPVGARLVERLRERARTGALQIIGTTVAAERMALDPHMAARLFARDIRATEQGMHFEACLERYGQPLQCVSVDVNLVGLFNVANLLSVIATWYAAGITLDDAARLAQSLQPPEGRMQFFVAQGTPLIVVDYAHTPDALTQAIAALQPMVRVRNARLWVLFGCGGERDQGKRALMGQAANAADHIVITTDNPRFEDPHAIIEAIAAGVPAQRFIDHSCERMADRLQAIEHAVLDSDPADVVLLAGKGHEDYQDVQGVRHPFSDLHHARRLVQLRHQQGLEQGLEGRRTPSGAQPSQRSPSP